MSIHIGLSSANLPTVIQEGDARASFKFRPLFSQELDQFVGDMRSVPFLAKGLVIFLDAENHKVFDPMFTIKFRDSHHFLLAKIEFKETFSKSTITIDCPPCSRFFDYEVNPTKCKGHFRASMQDDGSVRKNTSVAYFPDFGLPILEQTYNQYGWVGETRRPRPFAQTNALQMFVVYMSMYMSEIKDVTIRYKLDNSEANPFSQICKRMKEAFPNIDTLAQKWSKCDFVKRGSFFKELNKETPSRQHDFLLDIKLFMPATFFGGEKFIADFLNTQDDCYLQGYPALFQVGVY